jgi:hypothetical protein
MEKKLEAENPRYYVHALDGKTFVVADDVEKREICVCEDYDDWEDALDRAQKIASFLNVNLAGML